MCDDRCYTARKTAGHFADSSLGDEKLTDWAASNSLNRYESEFLRQYCDGPLPPEHERGNVVRLHLTYAGQLKGRGDAHSHAIRKHFHKQLKRFWDVHPSLKGWMAPSRQPDNQIVTMQQRLASDWERFGFKFVPLATEEF